MATEVAGPIRRSILTVSPRLPYRLHAAQIQRPRLQDAFIAISSHLEVQDGELHAGRRLVAFSHYSIPVV